MGNTHFTYDSTLNGNELRQGDILKKTNELNSLLEKYHSHYTLPTYTHFQILTQSCDLVRRGSNNKCSSRYITLAAIRNLDTVIKRSIYSEATSKIEIDGNLYCSTKHKERLASVLSSLLNNNSKEYFFLKSSPENGLYDDSCTFLHLSIAIKAEEHYELCLRAKAIELKENFRSKLGWLVGNIYSRIGTEDYVPAASPNQKEFKSLIQEHLERHIAWIPSDIFPEFKKSAQPDLTVDKIIDEAKKKIDLKNNTRKDSFAHMLRKEAGLTKDDEKRIREFLDTSRANNFIK